MCPRPLGYCSVTTSGILSSSAAAAAAWSLRRPIQTYGCRQRKALLHVAEQEDRRRRREADDGPTAVFIVSRWSVRAVWRAEELADGEREELRRRDLVGLRYRESHNGICPAAPARACPPRGANCPKQRSKGPRICHTTCLTRSEDAEAAACCAASPRPRSSASQRRRCCCTNGRRNRAVRPPRPPCRRSSSVPTSTRRGHRRRAGGAPADLARCRGRPLGARRAHTAQSAKAARKTPTKRSEAAEGPRG